MEIRDEVSDLLSMYTPEQIKKMYSNTIPKLNGTPLTIIEFGTKGGTIKK